MSEPKASFELAKKLIFGGASVSYKLRVHKLAEVVVHSEKPRRTKREPLVSTPSYKVCGTAESRNVSGNILIKRHNSRAKNNLFCKFNMSEPKASFELAKKLIFGGASVSHKLRVHKLAEVVVHLEKPRRAKR